MDCANAEDTQAVARRLAGVLRAGDVVLLVGELGAGKTTFTQGLADGLGVSVPVTSPTFTLVSSYPTKKGFDLLHVDVYRLETPVEIAALGLAELLEDGAVALIEWGLRAASVLRPEYLMVHLSEAGTGRQLSFSVLGERWEAAWGDLRGALGGVDAT
ncbi:MAG: tRNA (adenosine(37)-N6)-threonylcarbamoyltransferase complex ATPase subunit type 1 TsaE [Actinomycetota bacterium]|nr:tRNA (adenosine(37)-N6)-threonylcarbamoyltransferase complex ATPase subunit type 1 TsaE [Actinomycetota bacterium]